MNYYEEFGVSPAASSEQIHHAYKRMVRLFHPDKLRDESLKHLAECQMRRLNAIYEILRDADSRRDYDAALLGQPGNIDWRNALSTSVRAVEHGLRESLRRRWSWRPTSIWLIAVALGATSFYSFFKAQSSGGDPARYSSRSSSGESGKTTPDTPPVPSSPAAPATRDALRATGAPSSRRLVQMRRRLYEAEMKRDAALAELAAMRDVVTVGSAPIASQRPTSGLKREGAPVPPVFSMPPSIGSQVPVMRPPVPTQPEAPPVSTFAGAWFYVRPKVQLPAKSLYPPEYVEAVIEDEGGLLRGRYRSRYRIADRAIRPEVNFRFEGKAQDDAADLRWSTDDGAEGELQLKLLSENSLEVNWSACELGDHMDLAVGTAVLVRRR